MEGGRKERERERERERYYSNLVCARYFSANWSANFVRVLAKSQLHASRGNAGRSMLKTL